MSKQEKEQAKVSAKAKTSSRKGAKAVVEEAEKPSGPMELRLKKKYESEVIPAMIERFGYGNRMQVPRLEKVVVNMGVGEAIANPKALDAAVEELSLITGQRPIVTKARSSIAAFKLRAGTSIGCKVTLRGCRMYIFLDKLFNVVLPRIRDFRGLSPKSFDGRGNFAFGVKEQIIFPEIEYDKVDHVRGMDIIIVTTAQTDEESVHFLKMMGCPIREG